MWRLPVAPGLSGVRRMGKMGFGREMTSKEIDGKLAAEGSWVASEDERRKIKQMIETPIDPVVIKAPPDDRRLNQALDKATRILKEKGQLKA